MNKSNNETLIGSPLERLREVTDKITAVREKIRTLTDNIRLEINRDWLGFFDPNLTAPQNIERHREAFHGHGQAQFLATKLPPLEEELNKLDEEAKLLIEQLAKRCETVRSEHEKLLRTTLEENLKLVIDRIRPLCADDEEARDLAGEFSAVDQIQQRLLSPWNCGGFEKNYALISANRLVAEISEPIRHLAAETGGNDK